MKIKCIIIEDNESYAEVLSSYIRTANDVEIIHYSKNEIDAIEHIIVNKPDLLFMDIDLGNGSGFNILDRCKGFYKYVIFTTAFSEYVFKSYDYNAIHYILKPYRKELVLFSIDKVRTCLKEAYLFEQNSSAFKKADILFVPENNVYHAIDVSNIMYIRANGSYCEIKTNTDIIKISKPLKYILDFYKKYNFIIRVHKSYAVNLNNIVFVKRGSDSSIKLSSGDIIPISSQEKEFVFKLLGIIQ